MSERLKIYEPPECSRMTVGEIDAALTERDELRRKNAKLRGLLGQVMQWVRLDWSGPCADYMEHIECEMCEAYVAAEKAALTGELENMSKPNENDLAKRIRVLTERIWDVVKDEQPLVRNQALRNATEKSAVESL